MFSTDMYISLVRQKSSLCGEGLTTQSRVLTAVMKIALENYVGKGKNAANLFLFPHCLPPLQRQSHQFLNIQFVVSKRVQFGNVQSFVIWLTLSQTSPGFYCLLYKSFENTVGKGEIARYEQFLFPQCFLPIWRTFCHFYQI